MEYYTKQGDPVLVADGLNCQLKNISNGLNGWNLQLLDRISFFTRRKIFCRAVS